MSVLDHESQIVRELKSSALRSIAAILKCSVKLCFLRAGEIPAVWALRLQLASGLEYPGTHGHDEPSDAHVLIHQNLLSCYPSSFGKTSAKISLAALGPQSHTDIGKGKKRS